MVAPQLPLFKDLPNRPDPKLPLRQPIRTRGGAEILRLVIRYNGRIMRAVALDIGDKYIGVAVSDPLGVIARPLRTIVRTSLSSDLKTLHHLLAEQEAEVLVVGFPRNMNGTDGPQAARMERLIQRLRALGLPVYKVDERLSSREAEQRMIEAGLEIQERNLRRDEFAAAVILQRYFEEGPI